MRKVVLARLAPDASLPVSVQPMLAELLAEWRSLQTRIANKNSSGFIAPVSHAVI